VVSEHAETGPGGVEYADVLRISTGAEKAEPQPERVGIVPERPVTIDVERVESYTLLCTPTDRRALAAGFLLSEGVIDRAEDLASLEPWFRPVGWTAAS
jgi:formate dehydrogenase assembly factor FdhD